MSEWHFLDAEANHRSGLCVRPSPIAGNGLFAAAPISRDQAVGVWTGAHQVPADEWEDDQYGCEIRYNDVAVVLTPVEAGAVDYSKHPFAAMNEPAAATVANVYSRLEENDEVGSGDTLVMLVFYAAAPIANQEELSWHYGKDYDRDYAVGAPAPRVAAATSPSARFERMLLNRPDGVVRVADESDSDANDPDFKY